MNVFVVGATGAIGRFAVPALLRAGHQVTGVARNDTKAKQLADMKVLYPEAAVLVHPESPEAVIELADAVGSTSQLIKAAQTLPNPTFIVATDRGIFYKMQQLCPDKTFIEAPTAGNGAACRSCAHCPWMAMNTLERVLTGLREGSGEIHVDPALIPKAVKPLKRMLDFTQAARMKVAGNA